MDAIFTSGGGGSTKFSRGALPASRGVMWCVDIGPVGAGPIDVIGCVRDTTVGTTNLFDYPCRGLCWDIFYNTDIDVFSDVYTNGQPQVGHKVASIPIYQRDPALIVVRATVHVGQCVPLL